MLGAAGDAFALPFWADLLPSGEPPLLGSIIGQDSDLFPDGRILFCLSNDLYIAQRRLTAAQTAWCRRGADPMVLNVRLADRKVETITGLKGLHPATGPSANTEISVTPDGSPGLHPRYRYPGDLLTHRENGPDEGPKSEDEFKSFLSAKRQLQPCRFGNFFFFSGFHYA